MWSWVRSHGGLLSTCVHIWNFSEYKIIFKYTLQNLGGYHKASPVVIPRAQKICFPPKKDPSTLVIQRSENKDVTKRQEKPGQEPSWKGDRRKPLCRIFLSAVHQNVSKPVMSSPYFVFRPKFHLHFRPSHFLTQSQGDKQTHAYTHHRDWIFLGPRGPWGACTLPRVNGPSWGRY